MGSEAVRHSLAFVVALCCLARFTASAANQPNIIFIMADDLGNADIGYQGLTQERNSNEAST
jgi:hypothetical protein